MALLINAWPNADERSKKPAMLRRSWTRSLFGCVLAVFLGLALGCHRKAPTPEQKPLMVPKPAQGLSQEQAAQVLAKVGDKRITLGDYAAALDRMDRFERLRYQSQDRRKELLDEMISLELLADEARRQGLDREAETQMRLDQALRDEMMRQLRDSLPGPDSIPDPEVRAYFDAHKQEFNEPERRRVSEIVVTGRQEAQRLSDLARKASATEWGQLVRSHSIGRKESAQPLPLELEGDLGVVSSPGRVGANEPKLSDEMLRAAFSIETVGGIASQPVLVEGRYHILRLTSRTPARQRNFAESERSIRVTLVQHRLESSRQKLLEELKNQFPVTVNQSLLANIKSTSK